MATSVRLLLDDVAAFAQEYRYPGAPVADDAIGAIVQLGRALDLLYEAQSPGGRVGGNRRRLVTSELGANIGRAAAAWPTGGGRLTDLAGAAADLIAINADGLGAEGGLGDDQRWSGQIAIARAVHRCAVAAIRFPPYAAVPSLAAVRRLCDMAARLAQIDPPTAAAWAWLDRDVPAGDVSSRDAAFAVPDAAARLLSSAQREFADGTLHVHALLAASAAAQTLLAGGWPGRARAGPAAVQGWRVLQAAVMHFDDGSRVNRAPASPALEHADALRNEVRRLNPTREEHLALSASFTATRYAVNQLPALADLVGLAVSRWAESGRLFARARALPRTDDRATDLISDRVVIVRPSDVTAVVFAARATARLSASLALELDRSAGVIGHQPHPGLLAALRAQRRPELHARDARWARGLISRIEETQPPLAPAASAR